MTSRHFSAASANTARIFVGCFSLVRIYLHVYIYTHITNHNCIYGLHMWHVYIYIYIRYVFYPICWLVSLMLCHKPRRRLQHQCSPKSSFAPRYSEYNMPDRHSLVTNMHNYSGSAWLTFNRIRIPAPLTQNSSSWESSPTLRPAIGPWDMGCRELRLLRLSQLQRLRQLQKCYADVAAPLGPQNWNEDSFVSELVSLNLGGLHGPVWQLKLQSAKRSPKFSTTPACNPTVPFEEKPFLLVTAAGVK